MDEQKAKPGKRAYVLLAILVGFTLTWPFLLWQVIALTDTASERRDQILEQRKTIQSLQQNVKECRGTLWYDEQENAAGDYN